MLVHKKIRTGERGRLSGERGRLGGENALACLGASPVASLCIDEDGRIVFANSAAASLLMAQSPLEGQNIKAFVDGWSDVACALSSSDGHRAVDVRLLHNGAPAKTVELKIAQWQSDAGMLSGIFMRDIDVEKETARAGVELQRRSENALAEAEAAHRRLGFIIDMLPQAICVFDSEDRYVLWNEKYAELYPDIASELRPGIAFIDILKTSLAKGDMPEIVDDADIWLRERMRKHRMVSSQDEQQLRDGRWVRHDDRRMPDGGAIGMRIDITQLKQREDSLRLLFDANPTPMLVCDADTLVIRSANEAATHLYGISREDLLLLAVPDLHVQEEAGQVRDTMRGVRTDCDGKTVWRQKTADGTERSVLMFVRVLGEGATCRLLLTIADVTERIRAEAHATHLAHHDGLTGLPNRMRFRMLLEASLAEIRANGGFVAVQYIDLDGFKPVNDTFGHSVGDRLLQLVAERLLSVAGPGDVVARLGGDEFAILQSPSAERARMVAHDCIEAVRIPFLIAGHAVRIGASIGIAMAPDEGLDAEELMIAADKALYRAKSEGKNTWRFGKAS